MSTAVRALLLSALLTIVPVVIGVGVADDPTDPRADLPSYVATPLADFDTTTVAARRAPFCDVVPAAAGRDALGATAAAVTYANGDPLPDLPGLPDVDVAHEYGCVLTPASPAGSASGSASGSPSASPSTPAAAVSPAQARAWVFVPPVTAARAEQLVTAAAATKGCTRTAKAPAYGSPSLALVCEDDATRTASYRGLFGDAWLSCSLTLPVAVPVDDLTARTGEWCVAVARAAATPAR